ncbi:hypothetical protein EYR40_009189 [Pleurotus pulmonarius]|nr:hypothetical protein EYR40_009189 [Pleurotus pulmonarius]
MDEKTVEIHEKENHGSSRPSSPPLTAPTLTAAQQKKLWRKIDARLMPILCLMYLFSFLDRGNIGNARLQGLTTQLGLVGNQYNIALRLKPSRCLPGITVAWGVIMTLMSLVKTYPELVITRVLLGIAEAGLFPGVVYYLTLWYPRHMLQYRIGLFYGAASLAGAFSGLLAFGISFLSGKAGLLGWSWIFMLEGIATVLVGILAFFVLVDFPDTATFLTQEEREYVIWTKKFDNSSVGEEEGFSVDHIWAAFKDWQVWMHILVYFSVVGPLYGITLFLPSIINSFGYSTAISQLLTVPPYVFATMVLLAFAHFSDKLRLRSPFILGGLTMCFIGFVINISPNVPNGVKYFGTFFVVAGSYASFPGVVAWLGNNLSGQYKRGVGMALHIGIGNFSGAIASNIYRSQDSPRYLVGHGVELMFVGIGFIAVPTVVLMYKRINAQRDREAEAYLNDGGDGGGSLKGVGGRYTPAELRKMGDRAPDFSGLTFRMFWPPPSLEVAVTALVVETSMYMLYLVSQCASLYFLTKRNIASPKASRITPIFVVSVLLFALTTFAVLGDGFFVGPIRLSSPFQPTKSLAFVHRHIGYILFGAEVEATSRMRWTLKRVLSAFGVLAMLGKPFPVIYFMFGSTAILNVFVSAMIVYKVWKMDMSAQPIAGPLSVTARVAQTLLESAGIYTFFVVVTAIAGMLSFDVFSACLSALGPVVGISFCVIVVLVGLGRTTDTRNTKEILSTIAFQHGQSTRTSQQDLEDSQTRSQEDPFQGSLSSNRPPS